MTTPEPVLVPPTIRVTHVLDKMFVLLREHFWLVYGITIIIQVPFFFYTLFVRQFQVSTLAGASPFFMKTEVIIALVAAMIVFFVAWAFIWPLGTMAATSALVRSYLGHRAGVLQSYKDVLRLFLPAVGLMMLVGLAVGFGTMLCLVPGIYLLLRLFVVFPALVVERRPVVETMRRSADLMRGNYWHVLAIHMVSNTVKVGLYYALSFTGAAIFSGDGVLNVLGYSLSQFAAQVLVAPFEFVLTVVVYFELREVKEGFDLEVRAARIAEKASRKREMVRVPEPDTAA